MPKKKIRLCIICKKRASRKASLDMCGNHYRQYQRLTRRKRPA